jgi:valyl-tRNA synthetase
MSHEEPHEPSARAQPEPHTESTAASPAETSSSNLPKAYDPAMIEQRWAAYWVRERLFEVPTPVDPGRGNTFTMLLPPPNVTGFLHMGHMFEHAESDIMIRWHRMRGETALWVPGTDHAGIATQMLVERKLAAEGVKREELGRDAFTARVWSWKEKYGSAITDQMRRLGASVDWSREYFTMDDRLSIAVKEAFVRMWEQGLIYRGAYIVNWDPVQQTAVSDLEVESEERMGKLYYIRYPFVGAMGPFNDTNSIEIATTRPETMLGDVAVAVNPNDDRYRHLIGAMLQLPLTRREIPVIADDWANPEFGTGAVKVTPAHDPNDFAIGQRHPEIGSLNIFDETAHIKVPGGSFFDGLDRFEARKQIVEELRTIELLVAEKDHPMTLPISQRSGAVIEPRLSMQWFLAVNKPVVNQKTGETRPSIAQTAIDAVKQGHIQFTPEMYEKTYFEWMGNIHDWCISRQLWWGHRIPAWYCDNCKTMAVARVQPAHCSSCGYEGFTQETDVLDTWFSSGLLPFTVFGWPEQTPDMSAFYPTQLLITGFDILFFWVARMIMLGTHFMLDEPASPAQQAEFTEEERGEVEVRGGRPLRFAVPFQHVYIHALIRDANREKMSKTKGNVVDPIEIVQKYGTDAVRFTLASMASPGTDIAFSEARTEGNRAFANKIWNAARFLFMNLDRAKEVGIEIHYREFRHHLSPHAFYIGNDVREPGEPPVTISSWELKFSQNETVETRWILARLAEVAGAVNQSLKLYRFDEAANSIYQFFWADFCDWYLEIVKLRFIFDSPVGRGQTEHAINTLAAVFDAALRLLSPFMPFLTEELWLALYQGKPPAKSIALTPFPQKIQFALNDEAIAQMASLQDLITIVRAIRKELGTPEKEVAPIRVYSTSTTTSKIAADNADVLAKLARVSAVEIATIPLSGNNARSTANFDIAVLYERTIDIPAERERLTKDLAKYEKGLTSAERQLGNESFMAKAPAHIVEGLRKQAADTRTLYDKTRAALNALPTE